MKAKTKGWIPKRRAAQAARCRTTKPSQHSTGPKTKTGKANIGQNATKHGYYSAEMRELRRLLRAQKAFVRQTLRQRG